MLLFQDPFAWPLKGFSPNNYRNITMDIPDIQNSNENVITDNIITTSTEVPYNIQAMNEMLRSSGEPSLSMQIMNELKNNSEDLPVNIQALTITDAVIEKLMPHKHVTRKITHSSRPIESVTEFIENITGDVSLERNVTTELTEMINDTKKQFNNMDNYPLLFAQDESDLKLETNWFTNTINLSEKNYEMAKNISMEINTSSKNIYTTTWKTVENINTMMADLTTEIPSSHITTQNILTNSTKEELEKNFTIVPAFLIAMVIFFILLGTTFLFYKRITRNRVGQGTLADAFDNNSNTSTFKCQ